MKRVWRHFRKAPVRVVKISHRRQKLKLRTAMVKLKFVLAQEKLETRQMLVVYRRYTLGQATQEELKQANEQFVDILKGIGLGVFAVLPFAPITIPVVIKLGKYVGVDILPSAFTTHAQLKENTASEGAVDSSEQSEQVAVAQSSSLAKTK